GIDEKPEGSVETNLINAGVYGFSVGIFDAIRQTQTTGELEITATLNELASESGMTAVQYDGQWLDVSNLWDLISVNAGLVSDTNEPGQAGPSPGNSAVTADDVVLADNVQAGPNVTIGGSTAVGGNVTIKANAVVENAVIFPDVVVGAGAVVQDAVIGGNARLGANVTIERGHSDIVVGDTFHSDVQLGAVVGDNAQIGGGATLTDGAVVGDDVQADAGVVIEGRVESDAVVRRG
ncbi:MAG: nucleoside-diphosphate-sugar pyrophosphorylase, partial [uncultured archaeon A07HR60]